METEVKEGIVKRKKQVTVEKEAGNAFKERDGKRWGEKGKVINESTMCEI